MEAVRELNGVNIEHDVACCDVGGLERNATDTVIMLMVVVQHLMGIGCTCASKPMES